MILAIDVGNTNIVLGFIDGGEIKTVLRIHTNPSETGTEYAIKLRHIAEFYGIDLMSLDGSIISSVVPRVTVSLTLAVETLTGKKPIVVGPGMKTGLNICLDDPASVAADLIAGTVGAIAEYGSPIIVIDMGTATTLAVVDKQAYLRGGAIFPGIKLSYSALASGTSLLPDISIVPPKKVISTNTIDCMRSGAVFGTAAMLDGMIERMETELGYPCTVIATGGFSQSISPYCKHDVICDPNLLLKGLWELFCKNS